MPDPTPEEQFALAERHFAENRPADALAALSDVLTRRPGHAEALNLSGICLGRLSRMNEAEAAFRSALKARPDYSAALNNLGVILVNSRRYAEGAELFARAAALRPKDTATLINLANAYLAMEQYEQAITVYRRCLLVDPNVSHAQQNLGVALRAVGRTDEALAYFHQAASIQPRNPDALDNFATALRDAGRYDEAAGTYRRALKLNPIHPSAHWNLSLLLLQRGDFGAGWEEYDWRLRMGDSGYDRLRKHHPILAQPRWDGADPAGKRLYLFAEQGFGDTIQFARYLPLLAQRGARITLACHKNLVDLLRDVEGVEQCVPMEQPPPPFDAHCPLMSLPLIFKTTLQTIPADVPYLRADPARATRWRDRLAGDRRRKIGLVWAGRRKPDPRRSMLLAELAPLSNLPNVHWISLQKGDAAAEVHASPAGLSVTDWAHELKDFSDTAALMANLDLVITIDTAAAHLAGAMGKPVYVLLPKFATWRWLLDRDDSPWYPTMRLFRQNKPGDWQSAIARLIGAL
jgi:tetratricopeptide (TPR) repeat protein